MDQEFNGIALVYVCVYEGCRRAQAWLWARAPVSTLVVPIAPRVVMPALGHKPLRRRSSLRGAAGRYASHNSRGLQAMQRGRAKGEHSSTFFCSSCHCFVLVIETFVCNEQRA